MTGIATNGEVKKKAAFEPWKVRDLPVHRPTKMALDNPPAHVRTAALAYNHFTRTFWCYLHGDWYIKWDLVNNYRVNWASCQCPKCIDANVYTTGMSANWEV